MHTILLIIEKPSEDDYDKTDAWRTLLEEIRNTIKTCEGIDRPADNVLLIPLATGLRQFAKICSKSGFPYRCLFLQEAPEWVKSI